MRKQLWVLIAGVALVGTSLRAQTQDDSPGGTLPKTAATPTPTTQLTDKDVAGAVNNETNLSLPPSLPDPSSPKQPSTRPTPPTGNSRPRTTSPATGAASLADPFGLPPGQQAAAAAPGLSVDPNAAYPAAGYPNLPGTLPQEPTYPSGTSPYTARPAAPNGYAAPPNGYASPTPYYSLPSSVPPNSSGHYRVDYIDGRAVQRWVPAVVDTAETQALREVLKQLRQGKTDAEKTEARKRLGELVSAQLEKDLKEREERLAALEARTKELREQLQQRRDSKVEIQKMLLMLIENPQSGLGLPPAWMNIINNSPADNRYPPTLQPAALSEPARPYNGDPF